MDHLYPAKRLGVGGVVATVAAFLGLPIVLLVSEFGRNVFTPEIILLLVATAAAGFVVRIIAFPIHPRCNALVCSVLVGIVGITIFYLGYHPAIAHLGSGAWTDHFWPAATLATTAALIGVFGFIMGRYIPD